MAKNKSLLKIEGTLGGITFYKTADGQLVREKGGVSREKIMNDPKFARTRENMKEFKHAVKTGKMFRDSLRYFVKKAHDQHVSSRLTQSMSRIAKLDPSSNRGSRRASLGLSTTDGKNMFLNFNFNKGAELGSVLYKPWTLNTINGIIDFGNIDPLNDISAPDGATHFSISGAMEIIDFTTGIYDLKYTNTVNSVLDVATIPAILTPTALPTGTGNTFYLLKVEFFQMVNSIQYPLRNEKYNAVAIIGVV
jgi:hypothetical protein